MSRRGRKCKSPIKREPNGRPSREGQSRDPGPTPEAITKMAATVGGDPHDGERLKWLAGRLTTIRPEHIVAAGAWRRDRLNARDIEGIRGPGEQSPQRMRGGNPPSIDQQMEQRKAYHIILGRLEQVSVLLSLAVPRALVMTALETVVMDNVVPEMLLTRQQAVDALVTGLDALAQVYRS